MGGPNAVLSRKKVGTTARWAAHMGVNQTSLVPLQPGPQCWIAPTLPAKHFALVNQEAPVLVQSVLLQNRIALYKALGGGLVPAP
jgi:hypothetical protein